MTSDVRYQIILYWSRQDAAFIAEIPELPGCAADGVTYQEALVNGLVAIREWTETAEALDERSRHRTAGCLTLEEPLPTVII